MNKGHGSFDSAVDSLAREDENLCWCHSNMFFFQERSTSVCMCVFRCYFNLCVCVPISIVFGKTNPVQVRLWFCFPIICFLLSYRVDVNGANLEFFIKPEG